MKKTIVIITTWNDNSNTYECINSLLNEKLLDFAKKMTVIDWPIGLPGLTY